MNLRWFITGTDTEAGKTWVTLALMRYLQAQGRSVIGMKPVAAGCGMTSEGPRNDDALALATQASIELPYDWINPYALVEPVSPHLAAGNEPINLALLSGAYQRLAVLPHDVLVEGAGGFRTPLTFDTNLGDWLEHIQIPVIVVVGMRLGCLNHAQLTVESILAAGLPCLGWIASVVDPDMAYLAENIRSLEVMLPVPKLGICAFSTQPQLEPTRSLSALIKVTS
ncbi:MAG: dethiobiotin synthase [Methylococcales bacterium]|nr:dethiobiotin synthase [Methylococcales bacterium]